MDKRRKQLKGQIFNLHKVSVNRCFEPTEMCPKPAIRAHSIQNSVILDQLSHHGHVIMPKLHSDRGKAAILFAMVGRSKATTFTGLCGEHDAWIFGPIDKNPISTRDEEHLFLLAYRSVLREVHAVATGAVKNQLGYQEKVALGMIPGDVPTGDGMRAVEFMANAYESYLYKRKFDAAYIAGQYNQVQHLCFFEFGYSPTIAVSALFSLDDIPFEGDVARVALNVFPSETGVSIVFSFLASEAHCQLERHQHDLVGSCKLCEFILSSIFGLNSEPQLAAALSPCTSFAQVDNAVAGLPAGASNAVKSD
jgi:hypothetical protein